MIFRLEHQLLSALKEGSKSLNKTASIIALEEGLFSHAKSATLRSEE